MADRLRDAYGKGLLPRSNGGEQPRDRPVETSVGHQPVGHPCSIRLARGDRLVLAPTTQAAPAPFGWSAQEAGLVAVRDVGRRKALSFRPTRDERSCRRTGPHLRTCSRQTLAIAA